MNNTLLLVWAAIALIGIIAIVIVKLVYGDKESEDFEFSTLTTKNPLQEMISKNNKQKNENTSTKPIKNYFTKDDEPSISLRKEGTKPQKEFNPYIVPESEVDIPNRNISYSSQNQVLINYDDNVQKFQEPITQTQRDIMNQRNPDANAEKSENKHELKDLFTIDELIKESKRKDDEREKESKTINKDSDDNADIKESIKRRKESQDEEEIPMEEVSESAEEIPSENAETAEEPKDIKESIEKMHEIAAAIQTTNSDDLTPNTVASQKDISDAINEATSENEKEEKTPEISETNSITDAVIKKDSDKEEESKKEETSVQKTLPVDDEIKTPTLKTPTKVGEDSVSILSGADEDYEFGASIDSSNLFEDENGELSDLDYRKDLAKISNKVKNSSIFRDIRDKLTQDDEDEDIGLNEEFIRNVNSYTEETYDEYEPIINETHVDYVEPTPDERLRQENTRRVFNNAKNNVDAISPAFEEKSIPKAKEVPEKSSLKIIINNNEEVLRKGDEIIFNHEGETYSSKVYSINGDDIKVRYRRQDITIKPSDIKKIY